MRSPIRALLLGAIAASAMVSSAGAFSASFSWKGIGFCGTTSPAFAIRSAPKGTASLRFAMMDVDAPNFRHGGATIAYDGKGRVAQGAVSYVGPCPPPGAAHRYTWTIEALDAGGRVLGTTRASGSFPPK